jgi:hypothetical protein
MPSREAQRDSLRHQQDESQVQGPSGIDPWNAVVEEGCEVRIAPGNDFKRGGLRVAFFYWPLSVEAMS